MATDPIENLYPKRSATAEELAGRIVVLEALVVMALGMVIRAPEPLSPEQIIERLNGAKRAVGGRLVQEGISPEGIVEAYRYQDEVLSQFSEWFIPKKSGRQ